MRALKKILKSPAAQTIAAWLLAMYIRLVYLTSRTIRDIESSAQPYMQGTDNAIFAFWHGRMMMMPAFCPPGRSIHALISRHRDGMLISRVISHFGQATVSGSSSKGGAEAASEILRILKSGSDVVITPDGPRGPAQVAAKGAVALARLTGKPVVPVAFAGSRVVRFNSWDRFVLALPFGRIIFCAGTPIKVPEHSGEENEEAMRKTLERDMNALVEKAEAALHV